MGLRTEIEIVKNVFVNPTKTIQILDRNQSNLRAVFYLVFSASFFSLNYLYGTYIGNPVAYWIVAFPAIFAYNVTTLLMMFATLTLAGIILGSGTYPAGNLFRNLMVIVLIPHSLLIAAGIMIGLAASITKQFYVSIATMEYGIILATGLAATLSAFTLNRTRNVHEMVSMLVAWITSVTFIILALFLFLYFYANIVYSL
ncbi:hypothetical protein [Archaeoglobus sp.]